MLGFPRWVVAIGMGAMVTTCYMKFVVFGGPSGAPGLLVGLILMAAMRAVGPRQRPAAVQ
jgi:hypothetical protein